MSTILVNNITPYTGETVTISGSNILVTGNTTLGDNSGVDTITVNGHITASGNISASGAIIGAEIGNLSPLGYHNGFRFFDNQPDRMYLTMNDATSIYFTTSSVFFDKAATFSEALTMQNADLWMGNNDIRSINDIRSLRNVTQSGNFSSSGTVSAEDLSFVGATSLATANPGELYTLSGSQIFSSSAWPGGSQPVFSSGGYSSSLFVFKKA